MAPARGGRRPSGSRGTSGRRDRKRPFRERARSFVYDGQGEHERFGVFDPAARMTFGVLVLTAMVIVGLSVRESVAPGNPAGAGALGLGAAVGVAALGFLVYRLVWRPPSEREVLLQMAREEDESKALAAAREREARRGKRDTPGARK